MQDGSAPGRAVNIERICYSRQGSSIAAIAGKTGHYLYGAEVDALTADNCALRGALKGYESTVVPIGHLNPWSNPNLPDIILRERDASLGTQNSQSSSDIYFASSRLPPNSRQPWVNAIESLNKKNLVQAERQARIVVKEAPKIAEGWNLLGEVTEKLNQPEDAAQAYENAVRIDPKMTSAQAGLLRVYLSLKKWAEAEATASALLQRKADDERPEIHFQLAVARFNLAKLDGAESSVREGIRRDKKIQFPRSELVLASILEAKADYDGARQHMQRYLDLEPRATDAASIRERMTQLGTSTTAAPAPVLDTISTVIEAAGEAWIPGGMKALAKMAGMPGEPTYHTFLEEYCRAIARESSVGTALGIPKYRDGLRAFLASVTELVPLGEKRGENVVIRISVADRQRAKQVLGLLGWTLEERNGSVHVEPGYRPDDGLLQTSAAALGIDQIAMQESLQSGAEFQFEIVSENARLVGGNVWTEILIKESVPAGGLAAVFATDMRIAKTCAGLNAMNAATAAAIIPTMGLRDLAAKHFQLLYLYGDTFSITNGRADVPGGSAADPVWQKLAGANPSKGAEFFRALIEKDAGRLAAFYFALSHADAAHQQYFTRSVERAERFYEWFRDSPEIRSGILTHVAGTHSEFLQAVPLDNSGNIRFPGGQSAWFPGTELPLNNPLIEAMVPVTRIEQKRGSPLDEQIAGLLARNHTQWTPLSPYFESLRALGRDEFTALAAFSESLTKRRAADRNVILGEWYALIELISRGAKAGSLDAGAAARAFRQVTSTLAGDLAGDAHATQAVALLRSLAGNGELEAAVATNLLRLDATARLRFDRALELLRAPRIAQAKPTEVPAALSALVYAAALDPGLLVLNEDPELLRRHRYASDDGPLYARAVLHGSQDANGTHFSGGFAGFEDAAKRLMGGAKAPPRVPVVARVPVQAAAVNSDEPAPDFRSDTKVVEVYTTVTDDRGRYTDDLARERFTITDGKESRTIIGFEPQTSDLSVALLLDTTGSMVDTMAALKRAAIKLSDALRPGDSVAVYSFSDQVREMAPYTTDRNLTKRAVMEARPYGETALYDAIARAGHELTGRSGKKVVIVFTDGKDTASMLGVDAAIERAKVSGVPVYTIAQGEAVTQQALVRQLTAISNATGGVSFQVRDPDDMGRVFEKVAEDLAHGYMLYFQAPTGDDHTWRELRVEVKGDKDLRIRAREGYYP